MYTQSTHTEHTEQYVDLTQQSNHRKKPHPINQENNSSFFQQSHDHSTHSGEHTITDYTELRNLL